MTRTERHEQVHTLAREIALALGDGWGYEPPTLAAGEGLPPWARVSHPERGGFGVRLSPYGRLGRVVIDARFPGLDGRDINGYGMLREPGVEITVGDTRPAREIAAEIRRRFLPAYEVQYRAVRERAAANDAYEAGRAAVKARLAALPGAYVLQHQAAAIDFGGSVRVEVQGGDCVRIELRRVSADTAEAVLRLVAAAGPEGAGGGR